MNNHFAKRFFFLTAMVFNLTETRLHTENVFIELCVSTQDNTIIRPILEAQIERYDHFNFLIYEHSSVNDGIEDVIERTYHCVEGAQRFKAENEKDGIRKSFGLIYVDAEKNSNLTMKKMLVSMGIFPFVIPRKLTNDEDYNLELNIENNLEAIMYYIKEPLGCPRAPLNDQVDKDFLFCENAKLFDTCEAQCRKDLYETQTITMLCDLYGLWRAFGTCKAICVSPPVIKNAESTTSCIGKDVDYECDFKCAPNYTKNGSNYICAKINTGGYGWVGDGSCVLKACERTIPNGYINDPSCSYKSNEQCNYDCEKGFEKTGNLKLMCIEFEGHYSWAATGICIKTPEPQGTILEDVIQENPCKINFFTCAELTAESDSYFKFIREGLLGVSVDSQFIDARILQTHGFKFMETLNLEKCLDNIIDLSDSLLENGIKVVITNKVVSPKYNRALVVRGILPFFMSNFNNKRINFQRFADNFCYYKTNPFICQTVPKIWNADLSSLQACVGTFVMESCEIKCQEGFAITETRLTCMYQGRWYNDYSAVRKTNHYKCIRIIPALEMDHWIAKRNHQIYQYCPLTFYVCVERNENLNKIVEDNINKINEFSNSYNRFDFIYVTKQYSNGIFNMLECFEEAYKMSLDEIKVMFYYLPHGSLESHSIKSTIISRGFYPFKISNEILKFNFQTLLTNMCYRPMVCPEAPFVINAKNKSLENCKGTALLQSCRFKCKKGYVTNFPYVMCLYKGTWSTQIEARACLKKSCDFAPRIENAQGTDHCMGLEIGQICSIECKPEYHNLGSDFICDFDPSGRYRLTWVGNGTCYKNEREDAFE